MVPLSLEGLWFIDKPQGATIDNFNPILKVEVSVRLTGIPTDHNKQEKRIFEPSSNKQQPDQGIIQNP